MYLNLDSYAFSARALTVFGAVADTPDKVSFQPVGPLL